MPVISKIRLPSGSIYELKDTSAHMSCEQLCAAISSIPLSDYYTIAETSSSIQISSALECKYSLPQYDPAIGDMALGEVPISISLDWNSGAYLQDQLAYIAPANGFITFTMLGNGVTNGAIGRIKVSHGENGTRMTVGQAAVKNDTEACVQALVREGDCIWFQGDNTAHDTAVGGLRLNAISASFFAL